MSGNYDHCGGGGGRLMEKTILNFHFDYLNTRLMKVRDVNIYVCDKDEMDDDDALGFVTRKP